jgi:hypothetical protein
MHLDERENTRFTTPWGNFIYDKMHFELINVDFVGATFQIDMDIDFVG